MSSRNSRPITGPTSHSSRNPDFSVYGNARYYYTPWRDTSSHTSRNESGDDSGGGLGEGMEVLSNLIINSSIYKDAYNIFSSDRTYGEPFLFQLQSIPYSFDVRDPNFWDGVTDFFGGTSGFDKAVTDAFNNAMDQILLLVQNYYTFKNGLPVEQVDQLREAGINAGVTGEGVNPSSVPGSYADALAQPNASQTAYNNEALSHGITSFVEFLGSMSNLASVGFNSASLMGLLDIAERDSYNKQELHDLILSQQGVTTDSPFRVLDVNNAPIIASNAESASAASLVTAAENKAGAKALSTPVSVNVGNDPNNVATYEVKSGADWLVEMSRYKIANRFANSMIDNLRLTTDQLYAGAVSTLENEYKMTNYNAMMSEGEFNIDFFGARDGASEGESKTSVAESLASIRQAEANIRAIEDWMSDYRQRIIEHWGQQLEKRPNLAPYFYKAVLDFNMEDTFYHQNGAAQALKYGSQALGAVGSFVSSITGLKAPKLAPLKKGSVTTAPGSKGQTKTETSYIYE